MSVIIKNDELSKVIYKNCQKFNNYAQIQNPSQKSILFLRLKSIGCPHKKAIHFSKKKYCKYDNTKEKDGPENFKVLNRTKINPFKTINGWQFEDPTYNLGKKYIQDVQVILKETEQDEKIKKNLENYSNKKNKVYDDKNKMIQTYFQELTEQNNFKNPNLLKRLEKIENRIEQTQFQLRTRKYFTHNQFDYQCLADDIYQNRVENLDNYNIINKMNPFNDIAIDLNNQQKEIIQQNDNQFLKYQTQILDKNDKKLTDYQTRRLNFSRQKTMNISQSFSKAQKQSLYLDQICTNLSEIEKFNQIDDNDQKINHKKNIQKIQPVQINNIKENIEDFNEQKYLLPEEQNGFHKKMFMNKKILKNISQKQYKNLIEKYKQDIQNFNQVVNLTNKKQKDIDLEKTQKFKEITQNNSQYYENLDHLCQQQTQYQNKVQQKYYTTKQFTKNKIYNDKQSKINSFNTSNSSNKYLLTATTQDKSLNSSFCQINSIQKNQKNQEQENNVQKSMNKSNNQFDLKKFQYKNRKKNNTVKFQSTQEKYQHSQKISKTEQSLLSEPKENSLLLYRQIKSTFNDSKIENKKENSHSISLADNYFNFRKSQRNQSQGSCKQQQQQAKKSQVLQQFVTHQLQSFKEISSQIFQNTNSFKQKQRSQESIQNNDKDFYEKLNQQNEIIDNKQNNELLYV